MGLERNASKSIPHVNCSIIAIASAISVNRRRGDGLKDKNRLALRSFKHLRAQHGSVRHIRLDAEDVAQPVFKMYAPKKGQFLPAIELGNDIHIRRFVYCRSTRIGAMQE